MTEEVQQSKGRQKNAFDGPGGDDKDGLEKPELPKRGGLSAEVDPSAA